MQSTLGTPVLDVRVRPDRQRVIVAVTGEIDIATIDALETTFVELCAVSWPEIVLDLREVRFIDSTGLAWLMRTQRSARTNGWTLSLVDGSPAVMRLLELTGTRDLFLWARAPVVGSPG